MKRNRKRRRKVERAERVKPPPEAAQHRRLWPMQVLLQLGHPDGIDAHEFEAALQIVETFHALVLGLGISGMSGDLCRIGGNYSVSMSDRDAERIACWFEWSQRLPAGLPPRLVAWIEDELPVGSVEVLRRACRLWDRVRSDRAKPPVAGIDRQPSRMLTIAPDNYVRSQGGPYLLAEAFSPSAAIIPPSTPVNLSGAQMRQAVPRPVATLGRRR